MTENKDGYVNFSYSIKRVKDIFFSVNEQLFIDDPEKIVKIELGNRLGFSIEGNLVNLILRIHFHYLGEDNVLVDIQVENTFKVVDLWKFENEDGSIILPPPIIIGMVGMSISHGRALLLKNTAGTRWEEIVIPITNPEEVAKYFFPYMFNQSTVVYKAHKEENIARNNINIIKKRGKAEKK